MSRNVIVHIGTHKTGTTYLQSVLSANRSRLAESGISYPKSSGFAHHRCAQELKRGCHKAPGSFRELVEHIRSSDAGQFIVSSEGFDGLNAAQIRELKQVFVSEQLTPRIVFSVRNQCDLIESSLRGTKMYRRLVNDREMILNKAIRHPAMRIFELHSNWAAVFGADAVSAGVYEEQDDIVAGFLSLAGLQAVDPARLARPAAKENSSMDVQFVLLLQAILKHTARHHHHRLIENVFPALRSSAAAIAGEFGDPRLKSYFSACNRSQIVAAFEKENHHFSSAVVELPESYFNPVRKTEFIDVVSADYVVALLSRAIESGGTVLPHLLRAA